MSETIPPAMTPGEWEAGVAQLDPTTGLELTFADGSILLELPGRPGIEVRGDEALMAVIAAAMSQLSEGHDGKLTRNVTEWIRYVEREIDATCRANDGIEGEFGLRRAGQGLARLADDLERYLPPESQ